MHMYSRMEFRDFWDFGMADCTVPCMKLFITLYMIVHELTIYKYLFNGCNLSNLK